MIRGLVFCTAVLFLAACSQAAESESPTVALDQPIINTQASIDAEPGDDITFEQMLRQYQELNRQLETAAYRLQSSNAELCPRTRRSPGYTIHTVSDYPEMLQGVARDLLSVSEEVSVRTVRAGSPADISGVEMGDLIIRIGESYLPSGRTNRAFYDAASRSAFEAQSLKIAVRRGEGTIDIEMELERICDYPVNPYFSEQINGHTDGEEVWITSELIRSTPRDIDLALVAAHEMAHAIAGHLDLPPSKNLELEADRMALIMLARSGYDISDVAENWARTPYPHRQARSDAPPTHPTANERLKNARKTLTDINLARAANRPLNFDIK